MSVEATVPLWELEVANLRTAAAIDFAPLVDDMLEDHDACLVVVDDIVACWLRLPASVREAYASWPNCRPLSRFVSDYFDEIDRAWLVDCQVESSALHDSVKEEKCHAGWRRHAAQVRARAAAAEPPSDVWLERFAVLAFDPGPNAM
ncbi:MAG TPA: hypothetical protein VLI54_03035 [Bacillota bacterium]|nr:hypothetical protein [Bacillota bacterium]